MADLVFGMSKAVVEGAFTRFQAVIDEEAKLRTSAQRNVAFITSEFQMMQTFLMVADNERVRNVVVRTWMRQMRDLAFDVEDSIEFVVHLDKRSRLWLRFLTPVRWFMPCLPPLQLDEAVAELDWVRARVEELSSWNDRHKLISDTGSKPDAVVVQQPAAPSAPSLDRLIEMSRYSLLTQEAYITRLLTKKGNGDLRVISVWGSGGGDLGMASVVWNTFIDKEVCNNFPCRAWVKLRCPFNPHEFIRSLTSQFLANTCQPEAGAIIGLDVLKKMETKQIDPLTEFAQHVNNKRFLVVLEDLSTMEEWNAIATFLPKGENGSCIVVCTPHFEVASLSVGHPYRVLHLNRISAQRSVYAFYKEQDGDKANGSGEPVASDSDDKKGAATAAAKKWMEEHPLLERESEIKDLSLLVLRASILRYQVISVWGIAGVGKSALLKHVFCEKIRNCKVFKKHAWVDISHPFNLWDFSETLLLSFDSHELETKGAADLDAVGIKNPIVECRKMLKNRCLIVIDGLQSREEWDLIQVELLSGSHRKTVFIVITSEESIAGSCYGPKGPLNYNVKALEPEAAYRLFLEVSKKQPLTADVQVLQDLVSKCGGLPKLIVAIAGLLARYRVDWMDRATSINNKFMQEVESNGEFIQLNYWMQSYFQYCPDSLKPCIFYVSIFSRKQLIRVRRLVKRWIAEGYSKDTHEESADEVGERQFFDVHRLGIIQPPSSSGLVGTNMVMCRINGFFREYIISQRLQDTLVFELDGSCTATTQRTGRHLVISESWDRDKIVFQSINFSKLRSLTVYGEWKSFFISESMKYLRVLDLEDAKFVQCKDLKNIGKWFPRLKFLSLRGQTKICHLPYSVGDLRQLQTLDVRHTSIFSLPANITKLHKLQYIRAGTNAQEDNGPSTPHLPLCWFSNNYRGRHLVGVKMPPGIRKLTALHTLGVVNVSVSGTRAILGDLKELTQLRKLGVSGLNKNNSEKFFSAISVLVHLESLSVRLDRDSKDCLDGVPLPLRNLKSLKLHGLGDKLPEWSEQLTELTKIDLEMNKILKQEVIRWEGNKGVMPFLGTLPRLCILRLRAKQFQDDELNVHVVEDGYEDRSFEKVKILEVACSSTDSHITFGSKTMKSLEQLIVDCSIGSKYQFAGLDNLADLKEVWLKGSNVSTLKEDLQNQLRQHIRSPVVKELLTSTHRC